MRLIPLTLCVFLISGCGGENSSSSSSSSAAANLVGRLVDSPVEGIGYRTETKSGFTNSQGEFSYIEGETVTFFIGELVLPPVTAKAILTPLDLANSDQIDNQTAVNISILLQSLDADNDPSNGIRIIYDDVKNVAVETDFNQSSDNFRTAITDLVASTGNSPVTKENAIEHLQDTLETLNITFSSIGIFSSQNSKSSLSSSTENQSSSKVASSAASSVLSIPSSVQSVSSSSKPLSLSSNSFSSVSSKISISLVSISSNNSLNNSSNNATSKSSTAISSASSIASTASSSKSRFQ